MKHSVQSSTFMTSSEVKMLLKISDCKLMHLREAGVLKAQKVGRSFLYSKDSIDQYAETQKR